MSAEQAYNRLKQCRYGLMVFNQFDMYVGKSFDLYGEFSEGEVSLFRQILGPDAVVVEVGANIGAHTLWFARTVGPRGRVFAFEPQRLVFQTLCANLAINSLSNVYCFQQAVGSRPGEILVPNLEPRAVQNFGGLGIEGHSAGERVPVVTIDQLEMKRCGLLKIDVEGMEKSVLEGAAQTIARLRPLLYVENDRRDRSDELIRYIRSLGYKLWWHKPRLFNPDNYAGNPENVFGNIVSINMLCLPEETPSAIQGLAPVVV